MDYQRVFDNAPAKILILDPDLIIVGATKEYMAASLTTEDFLVGKYLFDAFPDDPNDPTANGVANLTASLHRVKTTLLPDKMDVQKYAIRRPDGSWEERFWAPVNAAILDDNGQLMYYIHRVDDVTTAMRAIKNLHDIGTVIQSTSDMLTAFIR